MTQTISIAIETSCRAGGVAMGRGESLAGEIHFDASQRHATQLVGRLRELLASHDAAAAQVEEIYVSVGPGSFTGLRVGITVARTMAQAIAAAGGAMPRCVAVPALATVAENARPLAWQHLGVILDAKEDSFYASLFERHGEQIDLAAPPRLTTAGEFLAAAPRPLLLTGEGLAFVELTGPEISAAPKELYLPTAASAWRVGRRLAAAGQFTEYHHLLPIYPRQPEAVRLWDKLGRP